MYSGTVGFSVDRKPDSRFNGFRNSVTKLEMFLKIRLSFSGIPSFLLQIFLLIFSCRFGKYV